MNGKRWRNTGVAMALSLALAAPLGAESFTANPALATEYYNVELGEFVVTTSMDESKKLDTGSTPGWGRTGFSFYVVDGPDPSGPANSGDPVAVPVCRFLIPPASHFLSASLDECAAVRANIAGAVLEAEAAFYVWLPGADGRCPQLNAAFALAPVYRMWDSVQGTAHRLTTVKDLRDAMAANGWIAEGYGADGVSMCVPALG